MTEREIKKEIKRLETRNHEINKESNAIYKQISNLHYELYKLEEEKAKKIFDTVKVGDKFLYINKLVNYHYDPLILYELVDVKGKKTTFRKYTIHASDGEFRTIIESLHYGRATDISDIVKHKKISEKRYKEEILPLILNPDTAEETIKDWNE